MPEATSTDQTCVSCQLWRRSARPAKDESAEYIEWRPCPLASRPGFSGSATLSVRGLFLTAPSARCQGHAPAAKALA